MTGAAPAYGSTLPAGIGSPPSGGAAEGGFSFPQLDPMMTLGSSSAIFATLEQWQHYDPSGDILRAAVASGDVPSGASSSPAIEAAAPPPPLPLNLYPLHSRGHRRQDLQSDGKDHDGRDRAAVRLHLPRSIDSRDSAGSVRHACRCRSSRPRCSTAASSPTSHHPARRLLDRLAAASIATDERRVLPRRRSRLPQSGVVEEISAAEFKIDMAACSEAADARAPRPSSKSSRVASTLGTLTAA